jgi:hypothetical protein
MAVHIELAELDEMCEQKAADGGERFRATRITGGLGKRSLPATVTLRLMLRFRTEPGEDVSIATDVLSHTGETILSKEDSTKVPGHGRAALAIDLPVTLTDPGPYTVHCTIDGTPWSQIISLERSGEC